MRKENRIPGEILEIQHLPRKIFVLFAVVAAVMVAAWAVRPARWDHLILPLLWLWWLLTGRMTTSLEEDTLLVSFGFPWLRQRRTFLLADVTRLETVDLKSIGWFRGWGLFRGRFGREGTGIYNVGASQGVLLTLATPIRANLFFKTKRVFIGSQNPAQLIERLRSNITPDMKSIRLIRRLAHGGMGEVWEAEGPKGKLAVKMIPEYLLGDPALIERLRREAVAAGRLNHPGIVRIHGFLQDETRAFLVMDLLAGETLAARLARDVRLPVEDVQRIGAALADALAYAHERGIIHRDLKPQNIFLTEDGGVKLIDLGVAKVLDEASLTVTGSHFGTPAYMAPEAFRDAKSVTTAADIWSLGVILYEISTGQMPFPGTTAASIIAKISDSNVTPQSPTHLRPELPDKLAGVVGSCIDRDITRRPAAKTITFKLTGQQPVMAGDIQKLFFRTAGEICGAGLYTVGFVLACLYPDFIPVESLQNYFQQLQDDSFAEYFLFVLWITGAFLIRGGISLLSRQKAAYRTAIWTSTGLLALITIRLIYVLAVFPGYVLSLPEDPDERILFWIGWFFMGLAFAIPGYLLLTLRRRELRQYLMDATSRQQAAERRWRWSILILGSLLWILLYVAAISMGDLVILAFGGVVLYFLWKMARRTFYVLATLLFLLIAGVSFVLLSQVNLRRFYPDWIGPPPEPRTVVLVAKFSGLPEPEWDGLLDQMKIFARTIDSDAVMHASLTGNAARKVGYAHIRFSPDTSFIAPDAKSRFYQFLRPFAKGFPLRFVQTELFYGDGIVPHGADMPIWQAVVRVEYGGAGLTDAAVRELETRLMEDANREGSDARSLARTHENAAGGSPASLGRGNFQFFYTLSTETDLIPALTRFQEIARTFRSDRLTEFTVSGRVRSAAGRGEAGHPPAPGSLTLAVRFEWLTHAEVVELRQVVRSTSKLLPYHSKGGGGSQHGRQQKYYDGQSIVRYNKMAEQIAQDPSVRSTMDAAIEDFKRRRDVKGKIQTVILYEDTAAWIRVRPNP